MYKLFLKHLKLKYAQNFFLGDILSKVENSNMWNSKTDAKKTQALWKVSILRVLWNCSVKLYLEKLEMDNFFLCQMNKKMTFYYLDIYA